MNIFKILDSSLRDNATGQYSHSRLIAMLVAFAATVFMWKLVILGGMTAEYFIAYLAYGTGAQSINKFLDNKDDARNDQARYAFRQREYSYNTDRPAVTVNVSNVSDDRSMRPPRN